MSNTVWESRRKKVNKVFLWLGLVGLGFILGVGLATYMFAGTGKGEIRKFSLVLATGDIVDFVPEEFGSFTEIDCIIVYRAEEGVSTVHKHYVGPNCPIGEDA